jgi:alanyl-tRNA synthetase
MAAAASSSSAASLPQTGAEIRAAFLRFYEERGHKVMASASLIPEDPTVLLTIAGMLPFKPVFLGQQERPAPRATSSQKCIRTNDIENVGRTARHHTFFEMLGNFSFGDYFKQQAIEWAWQLSTEVYGIDPKHLVVSVFREDDEAEQIWRDVVGVNPKRIIRMDEADNFWASGPTGPCGPCSEIYYDFKPELGDEGIDLEDDDRFIEFYNLVFMQYNRDAEGSLTPLANRNIDTGLGLERMAQILQKVPNNYETDLIFPLIQAAADCAGVDYHQLDDAGQDVSQGDWRPQPCCDAADLRWRHGQQLGAWLHLASSLASRRPPRSFARYQQAFLGDDGRGLDRTSKRRSPLSVGAAGGDLGRASTGGIALLGNLGTGREAALRSAGQQAEADQWSPSL